jgi:Raf kinase inhibitor-like YbhB/YbcL family protein
MSELHLGALHISSPDFGHGDRIPELHTSDGEDLAPSLRFDAIPSAALSLALVCHDPDAPKTYGFDHWVLYNLEPGRTDIEAGRITQGRNSFGTLGYRGPAPPPGHGVHNYYFHLYALDTTLDLEEGLTGRELLARIDDHILEQARLVGTYSVGD